MLAPPEMCLSLSPRNAAAAASLVSWPACLPAANTAPAAALNTIAANHHFHPHSRHHHHNNNNAHHPATLGTVPRANKRLPARSQLRTVYPVRLPPTSFVASQTPARHAEPRCSHTCDDTIQRIPTEHQRASFRGSLSLRNTAAPLYPKWTTGKHHLSPLHRNHHLEPPSTHTLRWRERGTMISLYV